MRSRRACGKCAASRRRKCRARRFRSATASAACSARAARLFLRMRDRGREPLGRPNFTAVIPGCATRTRVYPSSAISLSKSATADLDAQARNPYSLQGLWIPGSLVSLAPRNDVCCLIERVANRSRRRAIWQNHCRIKSSSSPALGAGLAARSRCSAPRKAPRSWSTIPVSPPTVRERAPRRRKRWSRKSRSAAARPWPISKPSPRRFREQESGSFVHFTSTSGLVGNFGQANYAAAKLGIVGLSKSIALDMNRFNVRSNCVSPFAWSRLIGTIPTETEEEKARVAKIQQMGPEKIAPVCAYLLSDAAKDVTGQIFAVRMNEIFLMGQSRPLRSVHRGEGWTPQTIAEHGMPALKSSFYKLDRSADVFNWDAI